MSTHPRGIATFEANGITYKLQFPIEVICDIENEYGGKGFTEIAQDMQHKPTVTDLRKLFAFGLKTFQPDVTLKTAAALMDTIGLKTTARLLNVTLTASLSGDDDADEAADSPRKPAGLESAQPGLNS